MGDMKKCLVALLFVSMGGTALGQGADVALVSLVSGDVTHVPQAGTPGKVQPFMKVRNGDRIDVATGGQVRIVFFEGARQELWAGPASFRAGKTAAQAISGAAVDAKTLPIGVAQRMARIPQLLQYAKTGGMQLRGLPRQHEAGAGQQATPAQARADYEEMRQNMPADDITPELYLYAALYEFLAYDEMKRVVAEMRRKQPDNQEVKALDIWLTGQAPN